MTSKTQPAKTAKSNGGGKSGFPWKTPQTATSQVRMIFYKESFMTLQILHRNRGLVDIALLT